MLSADRGAAAILMLAVALVVAALGTVVADTGRYLFAASQAQTAADAAALAAAPVTFRPFGARGTARQEAARFASANGATLTLCRCRQDGSFEDREVVVAVRIVVNTVLRGRLTVRAESRAKFRPSMLVTWDRAVRGRPR